MQLRNNITRLHPGSGPRALPVEESVRRHLDALLASPDFDASSRSREFLRYVVDEALAGRGAALTQAAIATGVFGRRADFDPMLDPIVRVQAGRLRRSLERYYLLTGKRHSVRIELPKGGYAPSFPIPAPPPSPVLVASVTLASPATRWPTLLVHAFEISTVADDEIASLLQEEITIELQRGGNVRVVRQRDMDRLDVKPPDDLQFELRGRVRRSGERLLISARVIDRLSAEQIWSDELSADAAAPEGADHVARIIAARLGGEHGVIVRTAACTHEAQREPRDEASRTILQTWRFLLGGRPEQLSAALDSLRRLTQSEPDNALAWLHLARLHLANYTLELCAPPSPIETAVAAAHRAVALDPQSVRARCVLAAALLVQDDLATARYEIELAQQASGDSFVCRETIGWLTALIGDWERGVELIQAASARNPYCDAHVRQALWAHHLRRGELAASYLAALEYQDATSFWRELMCACSLGLLGRTLEARASAAALLRSKPELPLRAHALIAHYIKCPDLRALVADGLRLAGVRLRA